MIQSIEFPVDPEWIKNPTNSPLATMGQRMAASGRTKLCIETLRRVFDAHLRKPAFTVPDKDNLPVRNLWTIRLVRVSTGRVDPITGGAAMKAIQDAVARWLGEPNEQNPIYRWIEPIGQESRGFQRIGETRKAISRVRVQIGSMDRGEDKRIELQTIEHFEAAAKQELRRLGKEREIAKAYRPDAAAKTASSAARAQAEAAFSKLTGQASVQAECDSANRDMRALIAKSDAIGRDPGEEARPCDLKACAACGANIGAPCRRIGAERLVYGVHEGRARAAGLRVSRASSAARAQGPRRVLPAAEIPEPRVYISLPWRPGQAYHERSLDPQAAHGRSGLKDTILAAVPPEHREKHGAEITLYLRKLATGGRTLWMYSPSPKKGT